MSERNRLPFEGEVYLWSDFMDLEEAQLTQDQLVNEVHWQERSIRIFGREVLQPRLMCWMGDEDCAYTYSGTQFQPEPWHPLLLKIKGDVERQTAGQFNSVLLNLYRDGQDSMGPHSDNEPELGENPIIASLSLGASRDFVFRHKREKVTIPMQLTSGSLLKMAGKTQKHWKHELPKRLRVKSSRVNLTFRKIIKTAT